MIDTLIFYDYDDYSGKDMKPIKEIEYDTTIPSSEIPRQDEYISIDNRIYLVNLVHRVYDEGAIGVVLKDEKYIGVKYGT